MKKSLKKIKIFLTGGSGFIGQNILEYLNKRYDFISPTMKELDLANTNAVYNFLKMEKVDIVIHSANIGGLRGKKEPPEAIYTNLKMFFNLLRAKPFYKKMIMLGSGAEYNKRRSIIKVKEKDFDKYVPEDQFGFYKYICSKYIEKTDFITHLRLFGVYGKYENYQVRFISNAICKCIFDLPITIENKNVYFDYLYVKDLVNILEYFILNEPKHKFYNVGKGERIDLLTIVQKIKSISNKKIKVIVKNNGLGLEYTCDISRLKNEIKNLNFTNHAKAIRELYQWYQKNKKIINLNKKSKRRENRVYLSLN